MAHLNRVESKPHISRGMGSRVVLQPGVGPQGLPGPGAAAWTAVQAVTAGAVRQAPDGSWIKSTATRTTGASFDATEQTFWTAVAVTTGTVEQVALSASYVPVITPEKYGAVGDGIANDTAAVIAACDAASALKVQSLGGNIYRPGATLRFKGTYKLTTLAAPLVMECNVDGGHGTLIAPDAYALSTVLVGHNTTGRELHNAVIVMPNVIKSNAVISSPLPVGSCGVQVQNTHGCTIDLRLVAFFETGVWFTALGAGNVNNTYMLGLTDLCKVALRLTPRTGGWVNQNTFIAGSVFQSENGFTTGYYDRAGYRQIVLDGGVGGFVVHANTFVGMCFEGPQSEYMIEFKNAANNRFLGSTRLELGPNGTACTVDTATDKFTIAANPLELSAGKAVTFTADVAPGGITLGRTYWVLAVSGTGNADFTVTTTEGGGGTAVNVTSTGTNVKAARIPVVMFDNTSGFCQDNLIDEVNCYPGVPWVRRSGAAPTSTSAPVADPLEGRVDKMIGCRLALSADQAVVGALATDYVEWDVETWDTHAFHSGSGTTATVPAGQAGYYTVTATIAHSGAAAATTRNLVRLVVNDATIVAAEEQGGDGTANLTFCLATETYLNAGDYIGVRLQNTNAATLSGPLCSFTVRKIAV